MSKHGGNTRWHNGARRAAGTVLAVVFAVGAGGEEGQPIDTAVSPVAAEIDLKLAARRGNTDVADGDLRVIVAGRFEDWRLSFLTEAAGSTNDGEVISESVLIDAMAARRLSGDFGLVAEADGHKDRFAGIDWRTTVGGGFAWDAPTGSRWGVHAMAGAGWQHEVPVVSDLGSRSYAIGVLQARGTLKVSDNTSFRQTIYYAPELGAFSRYLLYMGLTWRAQTNRWMSVEIDYVLRHDSDPILDAVATDHSLKAGFVFTFGKSAATVIDNMLLPPD